MTEDEFLRRWAVERPMYETWGQAVADVLMEELNQKVAPLSADLFIRIPVHPRVKSDGSLVAKAFYRQDKNYTNPFEQITDKVGIRFVVLLASDIEKICAVVESSERWQWSKDKDYESEIAKFPYVFQYQSDHYVVRCRESQKIYGVDVAEGTPCEIQIRTLLQHAHSELTHDTIYKPSVRSTPDLLRSAAKSMALIEATNDYFEQVSRKITSLVSENKTITGELANIYAIEVGRVAEATTADGLISDAFVSLIGNDPIPKVKTFLSQKSFIGPKIAQRAKEKLLFRQPSILLAYYAVSLNSSEAYNTWPLTIEELRPIFSDLGEALA